jgi:hypothetical protein
MKASCINCFLSTLFLSLFQRYSKTRPRPVMDGGQKHNKITSRTPAGVACTHTSSRESPTRRTRAVATQGRTRRPLSSATARRHCRGLVPSPFSPTQVVTTKLTTPLIVQDALGLHTSRAGWAWRLVPSPPLKSSHHYSTPMIAPGTRCAGPRRQTRGVGVPVSTVAYALGLHAGAFTRPLFGST